MKVSGSATDIEATQTLAKNQRAPRGLNEQLGDSSIRIVGDAASWRGVVVDVGMLSQVRKTFNIMELSRIRLTLGLPAEALESDVSRLRFDPR